MKYGTPEFFTLYEAESPEVLVGQDYLNRLNNPTPWTQRVPPMFFRDTSRGVCRVKLSLGVGQGGYMLTLRFGAQDGRGAELEKYLRHSALPPLADIVSVVGVHLCIADKSGSAIETTERRGRSECAHGRPRAGQRHFRAHRDSHSDIARVTFRFASME